MKNLAIISFALPGESGFPLNAMYQKPANKQETGIVLLFLQLADDWPVQSRLDFITVNRACNNRIRICLQFFILISNIDSKTSYDQAKTTGNLAAYHDRRLNDHYFKP